MECFPVLSFAGKLYAGFIQLVNTESALKSCIRERKITLRCPGFDTIGIQTKEQKNNQECGQYGGRTHGLGVISTTL